MRKLLYPERNRMFLVLSILLIVSILVVARYSTLPALPGFGFLEGTIPEDTIPYDIAMGYLASYIFYFIQVYIPQRNKEVKSLKVLEIYLRAYLRNTMIFCAVLNDYDFTELIKNAEKLSVFYYRDKDGISFKESFNVEQKEESEKLTDGIYNFLLKSNNIYNHIVSSQAFNTIDCFLIEQIQAINMPYWFETYENLLLLYKSGYRGEIKEFRKDPVQMELISKMKSAAKIIDEYLGIQSVVEKEKLK